MKRILLDQNVPRKLAQHLLPHQVETAFARGWAVLSNGDLIDAAQDAGFDILITADQNLTYQQNLASRQIAIMVLDTNRWPRIEPSVSRVVSAIDMAKAGSFHVVTCF